MSKLLMADKPFSWKQNLLALLALFGIGALIFLAPSRPTTSNIKTEVNALVRDCRNLENKETCYAKAFENLTQATSRDHAFAVLRELQKVDQKARGCHFIAHSISITETRKDPTKWRELMNTAPPDCSYGAAHGALEVHASTFPDGKLPKTEIPNLCNNPDLNNCTHGLGHLLLVLNEDDIQESLTDCERLPHDNLGKFECLTGVFMERITALNLETHGLAGKEALNWPARVPELEILCKEQSDSASVACWKEIVHAVLVKVKNDPQQLINFCEKAPGEQETRQCIDHAIGIMASSYQFNLDKMHPICEVSAKAEDYQERCYAHLVSATLSTVPQEIPSAVRFCSSLKTPYQSSCFTMIGNSLQRTGPENRALLTKECLKAPENYQANCTSGGNSTIHFYTGN